MSTNPYLDLYRNREAHARRCSGLEGLESLGPYPAHYGCRGCRSYSDDPRPEFSWAIPDKKAIEAIADMSPNGVVEIGAGGGYWAKMLRLAGVDVIAYDPEPEPNTWHTQVWDKVLRGDHTAVIGHADLTLLTVWPEYGATWSAEMLGLYDGSTVVYVGEGPGGCTGDDDFHTLLGDDMDCCYENPEDCHCPAPPEARFTRLGDYVSIPQWYGLHDDLSIYTRSG